ncbi:MAG TPA: hypothetical protein VFM51_06080 [Solirubrobacterales bacterium]|nr:hypothetical protein [Solirubrobacterales bacterium]
MLADLALSRPIKIALLLLIAALAALLVWSLLFASNAADPARSGRPNTVPLPAQIDPSPSEAPEVPPAETLRQRSLR